MHTLFSYFVIVSSLILIVLFLLQVKGTGGGFFGGTTSAYRTRRGFEETLFRATVLFVLVFITVSIVAARTL